MFFLKYFELVELKFKPQSLKITNCKQRKRVTLKTKRHKNLNNYEPARKSRQSTTCLFFLPHFCEFLRFLFLSCHLYIKTLEKYFAAY